MTNAMIGIQNDDNTVTAIECYREGDMAGVGTILYAYYSVRTKVEALVKYGSVSELKPTLADTSFHAAALATPGEKPKGFATRNEYARACAGSGSSVYLMQKNGEWRISEGVGPKGSPRWPSLRRVFGERYLRLPTVSTAHDDHTDTAVIGRIEALVGSTPAPPSAAPAPNTPPIISSPRPGRSSKTRDLTPTLTAIARDTETNLAKANLTLYVDGRRVTNFNYSSATDRLSHTPRTKLRSARHNVKLVARDAQGLATTYTWSFRVM